MPSDILSEIIINDSHPRGLPVITGCPAAAAALPAGPIDATITFASGKSAKAQCALLTDATPEGARWVELSFLATEGGNAHVRFQSAAKADNNASVHPASSLSNDLIGIALGTSADDAPIRIHAADITGTLAPQVIVNGQFLVESEKSQREITVLRDGPIRWQTQLQGKLTTPKGDPAFSYRITVELWKGQSAAKIDWMLTHEAPGKAHLRVDRATLHGEWNVGKTTTRRFIQQHHTPYYRPRNVSNPARVSLITDFTCGPVHVSDPAMLLDDCYYAAYLSPPTVATDPWLALSGDAGSVCATLVDFGATRPNEIESDGNTLSHHAIPAGHATEWAQGRRREHSLLLSFTDANADGQLSEAVRQLTAVNAFGRAIPTFDSVAQTSGGLDTNQIMRFQPGVHVRLNSLMHKLCQLETPGDKWNLGDTPDDGYTGTYPPTPNYLRLRPGAPKMPVQFNTAGNNIYPSSDFIFHEPVWANNEYDITHALAMESVRAETVDHLKMLRWTVRHTVEVDFLSYNDDPFHNRGIPFHSHFHNTKGVITSHLWTQGLLQYYMLCGDRDALDIARALGDKIIEINASEDARVWKFDREVGWALLSLVCLVEAGINEYRAECDTIADYLHKYDRAAFTGPVNLSNGKPGRTLERQMIDNGFGYSSLVEAMDRYQKVTGREDTAAWLKTLLGQLLKEARNAIDDGEIPWLGNMITLVLAIGYERTGNEEFIHTGMVMLDHFFDPTVGGGMRWKQVKPCAMAYRALPRFLRYADEMGLLGRFEYAGLRALRGEA